MSKPARTPGPWVVHVAPPDDFDDLPTWAVTDADGNDLCVMEDVTGGSAEGNARLIATAPDLLAACETARAALEARLAFCEILDLEKALLDVLRGVIARARGET